MGSKMLTGSMLVGGPLLAIIMAFMEPGDESSFAGTAQNLLENSTRSWFVGLGFIVAILAITIGTAYLARSMQGEQKPGSDLAGLAAVLSLLTAAVFLVAGSLQMSLLDPSWVDKGGDVNTAYAIGEGMFGIVILTLGATIFLLGIAIVRQKNFNQIVGGITGVSGAFLLVGGAIPPGTDTGSGGFLWVIGFLAMIIMIMVLGVLTIKQARN